MNQIVPLQSGAMPAFFQQQAQNLPDMNAAAQANMLPSFGILSIKGKVFTLKQGGESEMLQTAQGTPAQALDVVLVGVSEFISKTFYAGGFVDGTDASPDCASIDGRRPDPGVPHPQCPTCQACEKAIFGSATSEDGRKAKACRDSRRLAICFADDLANGVVDPILLRIPPTSLRGLEAYTRELGKFGAQPYMVGTRLSFDFQITHPQLTFAATGWLPDAMGPTVLDAVNDSRVDSMLHGLPFVDLGAIQGQSQVSAALAGGAPPAALTHAPQVAAQPAPKPVQAAPVQPAPAPVAATGVVRRGVAPQPAQAPAPTPTATPAPASRRGSTFAGTAPVQTAQAHNPLPVAQPTQASPIAEEAVQPAPADMEAAIDGILDL